MLKPDRNPDFECFFKQRKLGEEPSLFAPDREFRAPGADVPEHRDRGAEFSEHGPQGCPRDPHSGPRHREREPEERHEPRREDEEVVKDHVLHAHKDIEERGNADIAACPQHRSRFVTEEEKRHRGGVDREVFRAFPRDIRRGTEEPREPGADHEPHSAENRAGRDRDRDALSQELPGRGVRLRPDFLRGEHRVPRDPRGPEAPEEPDRARHNTDSGSLDRAEVTHHGGIDVLHQNIRELREDRRDREPDHEGEFLGPRKGLARPDLSDQPLGNAVFHR